MAKPTPDGVGIILGEKLIDHVLEVNRKSDRIMRIQLVIAEKKMNIISVYASQVGCSYDEKLTFWEEIDDVLQSVSVSARYCIPQCVRLIAGGGLQWVVESTAVTHFQCRLMGYFTSRDTDTR